mmetsp:Transcript_7304/g.14970  ORF Transcript_7304/g.14970 Transcript_7304/m.14970 type:complete len:80 (-) Transcript_7304:238-477(-)
MFGLTGQEKLSEAWKKANIQRPRVDMAGFRSWYYLTYIKPGRATPILHVCLLAGALGYLSDYPHIKHALEEEEKAKMKV